MAWKKSEPTSKDLQLGMEPLIGAILILLFFLVISIVSQEFDEYTLKGHLRSIAIFTVHVYEIICSVRGEFGPDNATYPKRLHSLLLRLKM